MVRTGGRPPISSLSFSTLETWFFSVGAVSCWSLESVCELHALDLLGSDTSHAELNGYLHTRFLKGYIPRGPKIFSHTASNKYQERCLQKLHTMQDDRQDDIKANNSKSLTLQKQNTLKDWDNMKIKIWDKPLTQRVRGKELGKTTDDVQESRTWISKSGGRRRVLFTLNRVHSHLWNPPAKPWNRAHLSQRD
jgi:hypothetical protein